MKKKVICTRGLSGSGKSFWAEKYIKDNPNTVIVSKDDIRKRLGVSYGGKRNPRVVQMRNELIMYHLSKGQNIIVADLNLDPLQIRNVKALVFPKYRNSYDFEIKSFTDVPTELCIQRCANRPEGEEYWENAILSQKDQWLAAPIIEQDESLPRCVITDFDGTIVFPCDRDMFSGVDSENDTKNEIVCEYLMFAKMAGYKIFILSGLEEHYRSHRESYLSANAIEYDALYMRPTGDSRKDYEVKDDIFKEHIEGKFFIHSILDDRPQMLRYWIDKGYSQRLFSIGNIFHNF